MLQIKKTKKIWWHKWTQGGKACKGESKEQKQNNEDNLPTPHCEMPVLQPNDQTLTLHSEMGWPQPLKPLLDNLSNFYFLLLQEELLKERGVQICNDEPKIPTAFQAFLIIFKGDRAQPFPTIQALAFEDF